METEYGATFLNVNKGEMGACYENTA